MTGKKMVEIAPDRGGQRELFRALETLLPIQLADLSGESSSSGRILFVAEADPGGQTSPAAPLELQLPKAILVPGADGHTSTTVRFTDDEEVPFPFKGRTLAVKLPRGTKSIAVGPGERVLLQSEQGALWTVERETGCTTYRTGLRSPCKMLPEALNGDVFVAILPLLHFLRVVSGYQQFQRPAPRACFIFDDPNLHWPRYGYVDYRELAARARRENYHVSFATIPLDAWFTHGSTAEIFRRHTKWLSLCVHGNDHTKRELAGNYDESQRRALLHHALRRIEKLERNTGLSVSRVMVPPHGACLESMLAEMPGCGFEAACISHGSLLAHNRDKAWTAELGYRPSETIGGCPVMPRWALTGCAAENVLMAVYLGQAIVLRGHHDDLKQGVELLDQLARLVNGIGDVQWVNMEELSRANYASRVEGTICQIRSYGRRIRFQLPDGVDGLHIEAGRHWATSEWRVIGKNSAPQLVQAGTDFLLPIGCPGSLELEICEAQKVPHRAPARKTPVKAVVRRALTEVRDRFRMN